MKIRTTNAVVAGLIAGAAVCLAAPTQAALVEHHTFDLNVDDAIGGIDARGSSLIGGATISATDAAVGSGSLALDGTGYVNLDAKAGLNSLTQFTIALWFRADSVSGTISQLYSNDGWGAGQLHLAYVNQSVDADPAGSVYQAASPLLGVGDWQEASAPAHGAAPVGWTHLALVVKTDGSMSLYIDGVEEDTALAGAVTPAAFQLGTDAQIGAWDGTRQFTGNIDDFRIYDNALSASEVAALVPEPSSLALLGLGGLLVARRRR